MAHDEEQRRSRQYNSDEEYFSSDDFLENEIGLSGARELASRLSHHPEFGNLMSSFHHRSQLSLLSLRSHDSVLDRFLYSPPHSPTVTPPPIFRDEGTARVAVSNNPAGESRDEMDETETNANGPPVEPPYKDFRPVRTLFPASLSILASLGLICSVFMIPNFCAPRAVNSTSASLRRDEESAVFSPSPPNLGPSPTPTKDPCLLQPFYLLIACHAAYWLLHLIIDKFLKRQHKAIQMRGYLMFYLDTRKIRQAPFFAVSVGSFVLLMADTILNDFCEAHHGYCKPGSFFDKVNWLRFLLTAESVALMTLIGFYIKQVTEFNQTKAMPDVIRPEIMHGLGISLDLKFPKSEEEVLAEGEDKHVAGLNRREIQRIRIEQSERMHIFGNTSKEEDDEVRLMEAEVIAFLIRQIRRKNRKVLTMTHHLARFTQDVQGIMDNDPNDRIFCCI